ncbi:hypothetical protein QR98_0069050 [Sarcoptes scabiei]|uniref:Uncharacterized protein n=1 Tax=Sarcoptes scabiei TaxID=52283 RepID=A0A132ABZ1_SARSC|nr:hypothetical protein QR98_0069050 [Sarcoptes scabiei]
METNGTETTTPTTTPPTTTTTTTTPPTTPTMDYSSSYFYCYFNENLFRFDRDGSIEKEYENLFEDDIITINTRISDEIICDDFLQ